MTPKQQITHLRHAHRLSADAVAAGHHPFAALLVDADGDTVLMTQGNLSRVEHAEAVLAREAARLYTPERLWACTLVTTVEPCAMCAGTQYWAHIGGLVYGLSEHRLRQITGAHPENPTLDLPCREVFARGVQAHTIAGPVPEVEDEIAAQHAAFWAAQASAAHTGGA